jgi:hypothetical protein
MKDVFVNGSNIVAPVAQSKPLFTEAPQHEPTQTNTNQHL